jgi:hypothetical protein
MPWRMIPPLPEPRELDDAMRIRPYTSQCTRPSPPDHDAELNHLKRSVAENLRDECPQSLPSRASGLVVALVVGMLLLFPLFGPLGVLLGIAAGFVAQKIANWRWDAGMDEAARLRLAAEWPGRRTTLAAEHEEALASHASREAEAADVWKQTETHRVERLRRAIGGDLDAIECAVRSGIEELIFPFETNCAFAIDDEDHAYMDIDLPEIEDVISETRRVALKSGRIKDVKCKAVDRNKAYAELVTGLACKLAATVLVAAPTLQRVTVAGHTQRQRRDSFEVVDTYVFEVRFSRAAFAEQVSGFEPVASLQGFPSRLEMGGNGALKKLREPSWAADLWS